jgi:hypothetical protein
VCVPFGTPPVAESDPACSRDPEPLSSFDPEIQCEWPGAHEITDPSYTSVRVPPMVSDLDGDGVPEIVFVSWYYPEGGAPWPARIRAIRGDDCSEVWTSDHSQDPNNQIALADLTGDGLPEVCGRGSNYTSDCVPYCLRHDGTLLWEAHDDTGAPVRVACGKHDVGINIANVDGAGPPEVVHGLHVFDGETGRLIRGMVEPAGGPGAWTSIMPALADVDGDGHVEALTGGFVVDLVTGEVTDWGTRHGYAALAELTGEHVGPEVVVVSSADDRIRVHALDGTLVFDHAVPGGSGGPPTVADLDGDGQPELATAGNRFLTAFDLDCVGTDAAPPDPARCVDPAARDGVMWSIATHEFSSGFTGSSVFDFEGDGAVEIVYADECWARVFDGATGAVKFSAPHESATGIEYPVVADVDGDFYTEIVVPHEAYPSAACPAEDPLMPGVVRESGRSYRGVVVYRDRMDRWAPSRPLWTQHTEHYDQRSDDGTVPLVETPSWTTHNSYRRALPRAGGTAIDSPDLTVTAVEAGECDEAAMSQPLSARVCNRGTLPVAAGVAVAFTVEGTEVCRANTAETLEPGRCTMVSCTWEGVPLEMLHAVRAAVDPDPGTIDECHEDNNLATGEARCPPLLM